MSRNIFIIAMFWLLSLNADALQVKTVKDNQTITAKISSSELSRIYVKGDRIQATRGINGAYELIKDEREGAVFVRPTGFYVNRPFNLFVTTEHGHTWSLLLVPMNIPGQTIGIVSLSPSGVPSHWEKNTAYADLLIQLMNGMANEKQPEGFAMTPVMGKITAFPGFKMQLVSVFRGNKLQGEVWCITNCSGKNLQLHPQQFFQKNVRSIALQDETLAINGKTFLFKVICHE